MRSRSIMLDPTILLAKAPASEMRPLISVIMPVYNGERFLEEAILSIREQSLQDFELLIIDDGSNDGSAEIIRRHCNQDARISMHLQPHQGQVEAMKHGVAVARGEYLARMDADDSATRGRLAAQSHYLMSRPEVAVLGTQIEFIDHRGRLISRSNYPTDPRAVKSELLNRSNCICHSSVMMRREAYHRAGGYRSCFAPAEDNDLWLRIARFAEIAILPEYHVKYRINAKGQSFRNPWQQALALAVARQLMRYPSEPPLPADVAITYEKAKELGFDLRELNLEISKIYCAYFEFAISLRKHRLLKKMLKDLETNARFDLSELGAIRLKIADLYREAHRPIRAAKYFAIGLRQQGMPISTIGERFFRRGPERPRDIEFEVLSTSPPQDAGIGGYIDEVLSNEDGRELTIIGWSPFLKPSEPPNKLVIYSDPPALRSSVRRRMRPDVAEKHEGCEHVGFSCWLSFAQTRQSVPIVAVLDAQGQQHRLIPAKEMAPKPGSPNGNVPSSR